MVARGEEAVRSAAELKRGQPILAKSFTVADLITAIEAISSSGGRSAV
jgi:hypothetical protein